MKPSIILCELHSIEEYGYILRTVLHEIKDVLLAEVVRPDSRRRGQRT